MIRNLHTEELEASLKLSQFAFQYELSSEDVAERISRTKAEEHWGFFTEQGELAAKLALLPLSVYVNGEKLPMGGIAGVATWPEFRRGGKVAQLLEHALKVMKAKGQTLSFLHPFQFAFYRKFGWETYIEYKKYELTTAQLPSYPPQGGWVSRTGELKLLSGLYEVYASRYNGTLSRSMEWWERNIMQGMNKGGTAAVYYKADGTPAGYILYKVQEQVLTVNELVELDEEARRGLWHFIRNHDSMADKVVLTAPSADRLTSSLADPRVKQEVIPYFMGRIVDAEAFLRQYPFAQGEAGTLHLWLQDEFAPWNQGLYQIVLDGQGKGKVRFEAGSEPSDVLKDKVIRCDVGALTSMLLGYERPRLYAQIGRLDGASEAVQVWESAIPVSSTYLLDFF